MREAFIGFDSAWTDNRRNPGAICAVILDDDQPPVFHPPRLVTFDQAAEFVLQTNCGCDYALIAIDQPTVVPNEHGMRPVERVAASLISKLKGGVQPARRSGLGASMFGDGAPIWRFLDCIGATQDPMAARGAASGVFVMEVFPALALPGMIPEIWERGHGAKYNPKARLFKPSDWPLVCLGVEAHASATGRAEIARHAEGLAALPAPTKADQDKLDALICLLIGLGWRQLPAQDGLVLGDGDSGYIVTTVSPATRSWLVATASSKGTPVDASWAGPVRGTDAVKRNPPVLDRADNPGAGRGANLEAKPARDPVRQATVTERPRPARVKVDALRYLLVERARAESLISYGEVAAAFGRRWSQGFGASLKVSLEALDESNLRAGEPRLMCLVVNARSRMPGDGFFERLGESAAGDERRRDVLAGEISRCASWLWESV